MTKILRFCAYNAFEYEKQGQEVETYETYRMETIGAEHCRSIVLQNFDYGMLSLCSGIFCSGIFAGAGKDADFGGNAGRDDGVSSDYGDSKVCDVAAADRDYRTALRMGR